ncbi:Ig-like domain-containing protein [Neobacillus sp. WH10]|uniref:Ig-like domain-containing protein n=1 Tax=Neobacillus sp. WH10 TaxID=3047873 RepID=UPI0024C1020C|nr:Ig-like domain-containing protein [Neobacillus sp. WH10]WHY77559.1 Ig-like domain-containing protein [Neobacillus sp. WH10]
MLRKLQKTLVMLLVLLLSGFVPAISAIAAGIELVDSSPEFEAAPDKVIKVYPGEKVDFKIKLAYTGGNQKNTSGTIHVDTKYYIGYPENPVPPKGTKDIPYSGETLSTVVDGAQIFVNSNVTPGTYNVPIQIKINDNKPGTGNSLVNDTVDKLTVEVLGEKVKPVVSITKPTEGKFYQSNQLSSSPEFTVEEQSTYRTEIFGWDTNTEGKHTVTVKAIDKYDNVGQASVTYYIDNTKPEIHSVLVDGGVYNTDSLKDIVKSYYTIKEPNLQSSTTPDLDLTVGSHTIKITALDKAGNYSEKSINYVVDNDAPTISFKFNDGGFYTSETFRTFNPYYEVKDDNLDNSTINASTPVLTEGPQSVTVSASDKANNHSTATANYTIDDTAPKVTINLENGKYYNASSLSKIGQLYTATDTNLSTVIPTGFGTTDGHYYASVRAVDKAGNATEKNVEYYVDTKDPAITIDSEKIANGGYYKSSYLQDLTNFYTVEDENKDKVDISPFDFTEGNHTLTIMATDKAGNSKTETITYTVDNTSPTISFNLTQNGFYHFKNLPENYYTTSDNNQVVSVVQSAYDKSEGTHELTVTAMDAAGNKTTATIKYTVDNTAPVVSIEKPKAGGYYKSADLPDDKPIYSIDEKNPYDFNIVGYNKKDESEHTVTIVATDAAGNIGTASVTYTVDNTKPTITSVLTNGGYYNADTLKQLGQYYTVQDTNLYPESVKASDLIYTEGKHTAKISAIDKAGNEAEKTIEYTVDNTKPVITFKFDDNGFYTSEKFKTFTPYFTIDDENLDENTVDFNGLGFTEMKHELSVSAADKAGNSNSAKASYTIDDTAPEVSLTLEAGKYYNLAALETLGQYWTANDTNLFDVQHTPLATSDGTYTATVTAVDKAGNSTSKSVEYHLDNTPPVINIDETKLKDGGFYNAAYLKGLTEKPYTVTEVNPVTDNASDLKFDEGTYAYTVTVTDKAGNTTTKTISYTVDNTAPTISLKLTENGIYTSQFLYEMGQYYSASDNNNDITVSADPLIMGEDGTYTLRVTATDKAGNRSSVSITYTVDDTKPAVKFYLTNGKHYSTKALTEALTGPKTYYAVTDEHLIDVKADELQTGEGVHKLTVTAKDAAGNTTVSTITYTVDNTAPVISGLQGLKDGQRFLVGQEVEVIPIVTDKLDSNPNLQFEQKLDTSKAGIHTVTVTATDQAGNTSTFKYSYHVYDFSGVQQPIEANGTSTFKKNSTIPVKFEIYDGKEQVNDAIATIQLVKITDQISGVPFDGISTSAASEGNLFRSNSQYIFNLGTKTLDEGQFKAIITILLDGKKVTKESSTFYIRK